MRHNCKNNHLGRTASHRKAMLANMASSLIVNKKIKTTIPKAKELRRYIEPLITKSKTDTTHSRRTVFAYLKDKEPVIELFREVAKKVENRNGGYTRILKLGKYRVGDSAEMCVIELVDYNENMLNTNKQGEEAKVKTRRGKKKNKQDETSAVAEENNIEKEDITEKDSKEEEK